MPSRNTQILLDHLDAAAPAAENGIGFTAADDTGTWAMSTQTLYGRPTGRIILACDDTDVLHEFTDEARTRRYRIQSTDQVNTILITPYNVACPLMCEGCPLLPPGVHARLVDAEALPSGPIRITVMAESSGDDTEPGSRATMEVDDPGSGPASIAELIRTRQGPIRFTDLSRLIFRQRTCGCLGRTTQ